jgi:hypothetical protein
MRAVSMVAAWIVALGVWAPSAQAQQVAQPRGGPAGSWRVIGQTQANLTADQDAIFVKGPNDNFRAIKFKVTGAPLNLQRMLVTYENGQPDKIDVRQSLPEGGESRIIDLAGTGQRHIRRIDFWYDTKGVLHGKASVTVFGLK